MSELNKQLFYHIDMLREEYMISINDFCLDICDRRQYSRYLNGTQKISLTNITRFYEKLDMSQIEFYHSFYGSTNSEFQKVNILYNRLINNKLDEAKQIIFQLETHEFYGVQSRKFYEYCLIFYNDKIKKEYPMNTLQKFIDLVDYPSCMEKKHLNFLDIAALRQITILKFEINDLKPLNFLYEMLKADKHLFLTAETRYILPSLYGTVANYFGRLGDLEKCKEISSLGIDYCVRTETSFLLHNLYYYKSLALYQLGHKEDAYHLAKKSLSTLYITNKMEEHKTRQEIMAKDYNISIPELEELIKNTK